jgi:hypothetical protein
VLRLKNTLASIPDGTPDPERDEMLAALLAAPPPRSVPPRLLRSARRQAAPGFLLGLGIFFAAFGFFFSWNFFPWGFWHDWELDGGRAMHANGLVRDLRLANLVLGGSKGRRGTPVISYEFTFTPAGGPLATGESYTTGGRWRPGAPVDVEYLASDPSVARIAGSRTTRSTLQSGGATVIFPLSGLIIAASFAAQRRRAGWLLGHGELGEALVQEVKETLMSKNKRRVYRITLLRTAAAGDLPLVIRRSQPELIAFFQSRLESKQPAYLLFDPDRPRRVIFPESLA